MMTPDQVREGDERLAPHPVNDPCSGRSSRDAALVVERDRLYVNEERTVFVRVWASGVVEVARRADPAETWGPPVYLKEERWPSR